MLNECVCLSFAFSFKKISTMCHLELRPVAAWQIHYAQAGGITGHVMSV